MAIQVTQSKDISGEPGKPQSGIASSTVLTAHQVNAGGSERDLLINYNAQVLSDRNRSYGNTGFVIDTDFDIKTGANDVDVQIAGVWNTLSAGTSFNTGTAATITANLWGIAILTWDGTTATVTWKTTAAAMGYATEAAAIADLGKLTSLCPASGFASLGYVTVQAGASLWTAGTDALAGGSGGTAAATTNYYNDPSLNGTFGGYQIGDPNGNVITQ